MVLLARAFQFCADVSTMSRSFVSSLFAVVASLLIAIASVAMGSTHGAVSASDAGMEAFITAGGDASDICGDLGHGQKAPAECVFCLGSGTGYLPDPAPAVQRLARSVAATFTASAENLTVRAVMDPARSLRGPPVTL